MRLSLEWLLFLTISLLLLASCYSTGNQTNSMPIEDPDSVRESKYGEVIGFKGIYGSHAWLGIPYAKAPIGNLRWRAPVHPNPLQARKKALAFGNFCPQLANQSGGVTHLKPGTPTGSEDCLYLNIWAPIYASQEIPKGKNRLPVMVWIHGGGNEIGHSDVLLDGIRF